MSEFPKMLYRGDDHRIVENAEEEKAARAEGFAMFGEEPKKAKK